MKRTPLKRGTKALKRTPLARRTRLNQRARKPRGWKEREPEYLEWIRTGSCLACGARPVHAHHAGPHGLGAKAPDRQAVPLCWEHHARESPVSVHALGPDEFERRFSVKLLPAAEILYSVFLEERLANVQSAD
jgi:hypothetical protein